MSLQPDEYNSSSSYAPQVFPQLNSYSEHPQHAPQMSSGSNQYNMQFPYASSTREAESAWQQPQLPALVPSPATYDHPTLPSNPFNSSYMPAEHTAPVPSDVPARMSGAEISNVSDSDDSLDLFNVQDDDHQRATTTGTMTGHDNGHATHLQHQMTRLKCRLCPRGFVRDSYLVKHLEDVHLVWSPMCGSCGCKFSTRELLYVRFAPLDSGNA